MKQLRKMLSVFFLFVVFQGIPVFADCLSIYNHSSGSEDRFKDYLVEGKNFYKEIRFYRDLFGENFEKSRSYRFLLDKIEKSENLKKLDVNNIIEGLKIGFKEDIFCSPWILKLDSIFEGLEKGQIDFGGHYKWALNHFPEMVTMRDTSGQDRSGHNYFYLDRASGKIFVKARNDDFNKVMSGGIWIPFNLEKNSEEPSTSRWYLHDHTGGPQLHNGEKIVEMQAQGEIVAAISNLSRLHIYKPTDTKLPTHWRKSLGVPWQENIYLPKDRRAWSLSLSASENFNHEIRTVEFMHPDDLNTYYEDGIGQKIAFGLTITLYVLSHDGHVIHYWDTGLPATFARGFLTPEDGSFEALNLSAAGSTIMVIGYKKDGSLGIFTRIYDYEINGSCPGLTYTYDKEFALKEKSKYESILRESFEKKNPEKSGEDFEPVQDMKNATRFNPLPKWREIPLMNLSGEAAITKRISILTTGKGNCARELRVEGANESGQLGYYKRMICGDEASWEFVANDENNLQPQKMVPLEVKRSIENEKLKYTNDFESHLIIGPHGAKYDKVELLNFHHFQTPDQPALLRFHSRLTNKWSTLLLRTSDGWILTPQKRRREYLIGVKGGEPKLVTGTFDYEDENGKRPSLLDDFAPYLKETNLFTLVADDETVYLVANSVTRKDHHYMNFGIYPPMYIKFNRKGKKENPKDGYFVDYQKQEKFILKDCDKKDEKKVLSVINENKKLIKYLKKEYTHLIAQNVRYGFVVFTTNMLLGPSNIIASFLGITGIHKYYGVTAKQIAQTIPHYTFVDFHMAFWNQTKNIGKAVLKVKKRLKEYKKLLDKK